MPENTTVIVNALAAVKRSTGFQGAIIQINCRVKKGKGEIILQGKYGKSVRQSLRVALNCIAKDYSSLISKHDILLTITGTSNPLHGPCLGLPFYAALKISLEGKTIPKTTAITGSLDSNSNRVKRIGFIEEKINACVNSDMITAVIVPKENKIETSSLQESLLPEIIYIDHISEFEI